MHRREAASANLGPSASFMSQKSPVQYIQCKCRLRLARSLAPTNTCGNHHSAGVSFLRTPPSTGLPHGPPQYGHWILQCCPALIVPSVEMSHLHGLVHSRRCAPNSVAGPQSNPLDPLPSTFFTRALAAQETHHGLRYSSIHLPSFELHRLVFTRNWPVVPLVEDGLEGGRGR